MQLVRNFINDGLLPKHSASNPDCDPCIKGKEIRRFHGTLASAFKIGKLNCDTKVHVDFDVNSKNGHEIF